MIYGAGKHTRTTEEISNQPTINLIHTNFTKHNTKLSPKNGAAPASSNGTLPSGLLGFLIPPAYTIHTGTTGTMRVGSYASRVIIVFYVWYGIPTPVHTALGVFWRRLRQTVVLVHELVVISRGVTE